MGECIFCDIVAGKAPASLVYQDKRTVAFLDISTLNRGQVVVIPRKHAACLAELDTADGEALFRATMKVCAAMRSSSLPLDGINLFMADGAAAGQEICHVHFLVIPRLENDDMKVNGTWVNPTREELDAAAENIRAAMS